MLTRRTSLITPRYFYFTLNVYRKIYYYNEKKYINVHDKNKKQRRGQTVTSGHCCHVLSVLYPPMVAFIV